eukprot:g1702.t1
MMCYDCTQPLLTLSMLPDKLDLNKDGYWSVDEAYKMSKELHDRGSRMGANLTENLMHMAKYDCRENFGSFCTKLFGNDYEWIHYATSELCGHSKFERKSGINEAVSTYKGEPDSILGTTFVSFLVLLLFIWGMLMIKEFLYIYNFMYVVWYMPSTTDDDENFASVVDGKILVRKMPSMHKIFGLVCVALPRLVIAVVILILRVKAFSATNNLQDLVLNSTALCFLIEVDNMIHASFLGENFEKHVTDQCDAIKVPSSSSGTWQPYLFLAVALFTTAGWTGWSYFNRRGLAAIGTGMECLCHFAGDCYANMLPDVDDADERVRECIGNFEHFCLPLYGSDYRWIHYTTSKLCGDPSFELRDGVNVVTYDALSIPAATQGTWQPLVLLAIVLTATAGSEDYSHSCHHLGEIKEQQRRIEALEEKLRRSDEEKEFVQKRNETIIESQKLAIAQLQLALGNSQRAVESIFNESNGREIQRELENTDAQLRDALRPKPAPAPLTTPLRPGPGATLRPSTTSPWGAWAGRASATDAEDATASEVSEDAAPTAKLYTPGTATTRERLKGMDVEKEIQIFLSAHPAVSAQLIEGLEDSLHEETRASELDESATSTASPASSDAGESESSTSVPGAIRRDAAAWRRGEAIAAAVGLHRAGERMRAWQQQWVSLVEEMVLVGSLALSLETPGSDVDLVCMTQSEVDAVALLRKVKDILTSESHSTGFPEDFAAVVIDDARIPILSITHGSQVLVDLAINSHHSIEHVRWFNKIGAVPPNPPTVSQVPVLTGTAVSEFHQHPRPKRPCHADLIILDPESGVNLAPPMSPATHILLVHEMLRARSLLKDATCTGQQQHLHAAFQPVPEFTNSLPASTTDSFDALVFVNGNGEGSCTVELARIHSIHKAPWWQAPFLARWDMQSRLEAGPAGGEERMISAAEAKAMAGLVWQS